MEKLKEKQDEILTVIDKQKKDEKDFKKDFKKDFEEFVSYWEKEAEDLRNREITEDDSRYIRLNFELAIARLRCDWHYNSLSMSELRKLDLIENKINNSLAIARSNFRSKHRTIWERLADNFGIKLHF